MCFNGECQCDGEFLTNSSGVITETISRFKDNHSHRVCANLRKNARNALQRQPADVQASVVQTDLHIAQEWCKTHSQHAHHDFLR
eukprot:m.16778 g.16778  ORF g.16778 m.16778 type:complete len:85 (+) comp8149_c0_seq2:300-554(+)